MLTDERIKLAAWNEDGGDWNDLRYRDCWHTGFIAGARFSESEVRKEYEPVIRQMLTHLEFAKDCNYVAILDPRGLDEAITAAKVLL